MRSLWISPHTSEGTTHSSVPTHINRIDLNRINCLQAAAWQTLRPPFLFLYGFVCTLIAPPATVNAARCSTKLASRADWFRRQFKLHIRFFSSPFVKSQNNFVAVFGAFDSGQDYVIGVHTNETVRWRKIATVILSGHHPQLVIQFVSATNRTSVSPSAGMRV